MKSKDIAFDEYLEMNFLSKELKKEVRLTLSDGLYASEEDLKEEYRMKIANFINNMSSWYNKAVDAIAQRAGDVYKISDIRENDVELISIFILFEQDEDELYGLNFRVKFDEEHGCGLKIKGNDFEIIEVGTGDVAFC